MKVSHSAQAQQPSTIPPPPPRPQASAAWFSNIIYELPGPCLERPRLIIAPQFEDAGAFEGGAAIVRRDGKYGLIDTTGAFLVEPVYRGIERLADQVYVLEKTDLKQELFLAAPQKRFPTSSVRKRDLYLSRDFPPVETRLLPVEIGGRWGYVNYKGVPVIPAIYDCAQWFYNGRAAACRDSFLLVLDDIGRELTPPKFRAVRPFSEGLAAASIESGQWGILDSLGKWTAATLSEPITEAEWFTFGFLRVKTPAGPKYLHRDGKELLPGRHAGKIPLGPDVVFVPTIKEGWQLVRPNGEVFFQTTQWHYARSGDLKAADGLMPVWDNKLYAYLDYHTGKIAIPFQFTNPSGFKDGYALAIIGQQSYRIDRRGKRAGRLDGWPRTAVGNGLFAVSPEKDSVFLVNQQGKIIRGFSPGTKLMPGWIVEKKKNYTRWVDLKTGLPVAAESGTQTRPFGNGLAPFQIIESGKLVYGYIADPRTLPAKSLPPSATWMGGTWQGDTLFAPYNDVDLLLTVCSSSPVEAEWTVDGKVVARKRTADAVHDLGVLLYRQNVTTPAAGAKPRVVRVRLRNSAGETVLERRVMRRPGS
jgi:hypothetical protein